ncbi:MULTISPECIES: hypothetical protein [unclassified Pseudodesulfovibrio]|uniref:hypothetical protein n=1 Tax=unclassified Pseudodesulfovibrio TaxID=2661612 RepID=UPI0013E39664|nr:MULTISPECIES: hypothetical protein [unclassified Pseudodesulfovibrio]MCJ2164427.1 hypothetical protein [Pseudodesulfovibrio sp. S3-i]
MRGQGRFEYWPELVLVLLMLSVLVLDLTLYENLRPYGENGSQSVTVIKAN